MKIDIRKFEAVIFDLDGTLVDSMGMWDRIDDEYLSGLGLRKPADLQRKLEGKSFEETAVYFRNFFGIKDSVAEIGNTWLKMADEKYRHEVSLKPGVREFLDYLKNEGIKIGIASSNHLSLITGCLVSLGVLDYFSAIVTCDDVSADKPDPSVYLTAAENLGADPAGCLVFEDVPAGILSGRNAGMTVCAVEDEYSAPVAGQKADLADAVIADYRELIPPAHSFG